jgi:hypothetical protein
MRAVLFLPRFRWERVTLFVSVNWLHESGSAGIWSFAKSGESGESGTRYRSFSVNVGAFASNSAIEVGTTVYLSFNF